MASQQGKAVRGWPAGLHLDSVIGVGVGCDAPVNVEDLTLGKEI